MYIERFQSAHKLQSFPLASTEYKMTADKKK